VKAQRPVLCVLVDAFRHDYLNALNAPFLSFCAARGRSARMHPILGYSDSIRATIFSGSYPDEHGYWMEYCFRPEAKAFSPLDRLGRLDELRGDFFKRGIKFSLSATLVRALAARRGYEHLSLRHFPFRGLGSFDWTLHRQMTAPGALGVPTLFDDLTEAGIAWSYLDSAKLGRRGLLRGLDRLSPETQFVFAYLHQIDMASHLVGLDSRLFWKVVRRTDALVEQVVDSVRRRLGEPELVVFSDHGMSKVDRLVEFPDLWLHPAFPDRFCFALDATMVRLWYHDDDPALRSKLRGRITAAAPGHFLSRKEMTALHLNFGNRLYGDEIYLLDPPVAIFPNFHSMLRPKAMHAYHPDQEDQHGIFIAPAGEAVDETVELVEVNALCRRLLGLNARTQEGHKPLTETYV
jgi:hypothetical protein